MRKIFMAFGLVIGLYLFGRAVAEPFIANLSDPSVYRHDWGGPSLAGVLAVHCGPGLVSGAVIVTALIRRFGRPPLGGPPPGAGGDPAPTTAGASGRGQRQP